MARHHWHLLSLFLALSLLNCVTQPTTSAPKRPTDIIIADFEQGHFVGFSAQGIAFGSGPQFQAETASTPVSGFVGQGFASSHMRGVKSATGALHSEIFQIERPYINFLAGGLHDPTTLSIRLLVDNKVVKESSGNAGEGFQVEALTWFFWDVRAFLGRPARIEIIDDNIEANGYLLVDHLVMSARPPTRRDQAPALIDSAGQATLRLAEQFTHLQERPIFHLTPEAGWMGSPAAAVHHNGVSHLFFQHNPYAAMPGDTYWGHTFSVDGEHWERAPAALAPAYDDGESHCLSGSAVTRPDGKLHLFYSSVGPRPVQIWNAVSTDAAATTYEKTRGKLTFGSGPGGATPLVQERDPFVFRIKDVWFLIVGGKNPQGKGAVALYRSSDLQTWQFVGVPFTAAEGPIEAPLFFSLDGRWVLVYSDSQRVRYATGNFDVDSAAFQVQQSGTLDQGTQASGKKWFFQAPRMFVPSDGKPLLMGQLDLTSAGSAWRGVVSVPRSLSLLPDGTLLQWPVASLSSLRLEGLRIAEQHLKEAAMRLDSIAADAFDLSLGLALGDARRAGLKLRRSRNGGRATIVGFDGQKLLIDDQVVPLPKASTAISLRILVDRGAIEIFVNNGELVISRPLRARPDETGFELFSAGGEAVFSNLELHPMGSIWR